MEKFGPVQQWSKRLFGSAYTLEVGAAIWAQPKPVINPTELRRFLEGFSEKAPAHSSVVKELEKLEATGLLARLPDEGPYVRFERQASVYYELCHKLRDEVRGPPQTERLF